MKKHKVLLREISIEDVPVINSWRNNKALIEQLGSEFRYVGLDTDKKWYETYLANRDRNVRLAITIEEFGTILGVIYLLDINWLSKNCEFAIQIGEEQALSKGLGYEASKQAIDYAFNDLNLHRIYLTVLEENTRAIGLYEKLGFLVEGTLRQSIYKNKSYKNQILMALLQSSWE